MLRVVTRIGNVFVTVLGTAVGLFITITFILGIAKAISWVWRF